MPGIELYLARRFLHQPNQAVNIDFGYFGKLHPHHALPLFQRGNGKFSADNPYFRQRQKRGGLVGQGAETVEQFSVHPLQFFLVPNGGDHFIHFHFFLRGINVAVGNKARIFQFQQSLGFRFITGILKPLYRLVKQAQVQVKAHGINVA